MTQTLVNTIINSITTNNEGNFAIVLTKRNFYTKRTFNFILTTTTTHEEAKDLSNKLRTQYADELKTIKATISCATTDLFTRGYKYNFAKQS